MQNKFKERIRQTVIMLVHHQRPRCLERISLEQPWPVRDYLHIRQTSKNERRISKGAIEWPCDLVSALDISILKLRNIEANTYRYDYLSMPIKQYQHSTV